MPLFENTFTVKVPPEVAFDYLADRCNEVEWNPGCELVEPLTPPPVSVGTRFRAKWKGAPIIEGEVLEFDRPHRVVSGNGGALEIRAAWTFTSTESGTDILSQFDVTPHGIMTLVFPLFARKFRRDSVANLARIGALLEDRSTASAT